MSETPTGDSTPVEPVAAASIPAYAVPPAPHRGNGFGLAALILGIVAILGAAFPVINIFSAILAVVGLILGIVGLTRKGASKGTSIAGTIISGVALLIVIIASIILALTLDVLDQATDDPAPAPVETVAPEETASPDQQIPEGDPGSLTNPVPLGVPVTFSVGGVDQWAFTVQSTTLNANDLVVAADPNNLPAAADSQYAMLNARFEHVGPDLGTPSNDLAIIFVQPDGTYYSESEVGAVAPDPDWRGIVDLQQASISGNAIVLIPAGATGVWGVNIVGTDVVVYFAIE